MFPLLVLAALVPRPVWTGPGATHLGAVSQDGRYLTGVDPATGQLLLRDTETNTESRLGEALPKQFAYFSAISPDAASIAYAYFNEQGYYELRLSGRSSSKVLFSNEEAGFVQPCAFRPDGKQILTLLFRKDNISQIALISTETGGLKVLKSLNWVYPKRMDFSPDGRWIVYDNFAQDGVPQRDIFLLSADGAKETRLVSGPSEDVFPFFSRDGRRVYYASDQALRSVDVETRKSKEVAANLGRFLPLGISKSGTIYYAIRTGATNVYRGGIDLATAKLTTKPELLGEGASAVFSPDGKSIAWLARRATENFGVDARYIAVARDGPPRILTPKLAHIESIAWTPDGRSLLASGSDAKARGGVYRIDALSGELTPLQAETGAPYKGYPAAGNYFARDGDLFKFGEEKAVYSGSHRIEAIAASFDGKSAAVSDGRDVTVIKARTIEGFGSFLQWTPDGKKLLLARNDEIWLAPVDDGTSLRVAKTAAAIESLSLHPNGGEILFTAGRAKSEIWAIDVE